MSEADRDKWNRRYRADHSGNTPRVDPAADQAPGTGAARAAPTSPARPSRFLREIAEHLPRTGRALDVAGGAGRNAVWLAQRGLEVTLVDIADAALALAAEAAAGAGVSLQLERRDLEVDALPEGPFDLVLCSHFLDRRLFPAFAGALAPRGLFVFVQPTESNLNRHLHPSARFLLADGEAVRLVTTAGMVIVRSDEGWFDDGGGSEQHLARVVARRA